MHADAALCKLRPLWGSLIDNAFVIQSISCAVQMETFFQRFIYIYMKLYLICRQNRRRAIG